jgi:CRISPR-associated protein Cmr3
MSIWLIEPLDPLIARDGRPAAVGRFDTVGFPYPSMTAGAVRTRMGSEGGAFTLPRTALKELKENVEVRGPILAELDSESGEVRSWYPPAPRDAVFFRPEEQDHPDLYRLLPRRLNEGEAMDSLGGRGLLPLATAGKAPTGKPPEGIPSFWSWDVFENWLIDPADRSAVELSTLGLRKLPVETRAHLAIQPGERVGMEGMLFQTAGLRFLSLEEKDQKDTKDERDGGGAFWKTRRLALSVWSEGGRVAGRELSLARQIAPLGGERRLAQWCEASKAWPELPGEVRESIIENGRARLILLTPAIFAGGALPGWNGGTGPWGSASVKVTVRAASVPRPEVVSGWDLAADNGPDKPRGRPKPTRRLAAAGSVYFLDLEGTRDDRRRWCEGTWLAAVSDDAQDRRDGFGLAVLGTWEETT